VKALAIIVLVACVDEARDAIPAADESVCEQLAAERGAECATVYQFAMLTDRPLRHVELCVPERYLEYAERMHGHAWPSDDERFRPYALAGVDPPCFWGGDGPGCNAFDGCWSTP
jgi:hypothetical protein